MLDTTLLVALGGGAGIALLLRELVSVVAALRNGVSAREGKRRTDIVQQRDEALVKATQQEERADGERDRRISWQLYATGLQRQLILAGIAYDAEPENARTMQPHEIEKLRKEMKEK